MHPSRDDLHSLLLGTLVEDQADSLVHHVDGCSHCEQVMLELEDESDEFLHDLKQSPGDDPFEQESDCRQLVSVVKAIGREASVSSQRQAESAAEHDLGKIGQYRLLAKLGEGGMGAVYKALHTRLRRVVALKVLPAERIQDQAALARFDREMQAVGQLNHPNIVAAHDAGEADGMHYLVMELVEGYDLFELVKRLGPLDAADACELIRQSAVGLEHAHQRSMVHRDIKPSNIMLARTEDGAPVVKLLDMGLALLDDPHTPGGELTSTGQMMGTRDYMSPEQGTDTHNVDIRADIYSLGATLFKLLCGEAPFSNEEYNTHGKMLIALATKTPPSIGGKRQGLPAELVSVVDRMLANERDDRPATPQQLAELLAPFTAGADLRAFLDAASVDRDTETKIDKSAAATHESLKSESAETARTVSAPVPDKEGDRSASGRPEIEPTKIVTSENQSAGSTDSANVQPWQSEQTKTKPAPSGPAPRAKAASRRKLPWYTNRRNQIIAAAALAGFVLLSAIIFYIKTDHGTIVVEIDESEESIQVTVEGPDVLITDKQNESQPIKLRPGQHKLHIRRGDLEFDTDKFTLRRGDKVILSVRVVEGELHVVRKDEGETVIGSKTMPRPNYALAFDGKSSYVEIPWKHDGKRALTLEAWAVVQQPFGMLMGDAQQGGLAISYTTGEDAPDTPTWAFMAHDGVYRYARENSPIPRGRTVHLAGVFDGSSELRFYVDGTLQSRTTCADTLRVTNVPFLFGANPVVKHRGQFFHGIIDEVRISSVARYEKDFTPAERFEPDEHTLALYHFDEGQGEIAHDSSGNNHHGKIIGAKWVKTDETE